MFRRGHRQGWRARVAVATATVAASSVLSAGVGTAIAAPTPLATKYDSLVTDDGWRVELRASELVVNPMSNIANSFASREGWISARVGALITPAVGRTPTQPVNTGVLEQFLLVGCQVDVSDGATFGFGSSFGPNDHPVTTVGDRTNHPQRHQHPRGGRAEHGCPCAHRHPQPYCRTTTYRSSS
ncbi:MspA family porin [Gordonia paraffinivorans]|uniref:MspA family porin n=1 Tax=Gordonia paraffinivorans TaxID=175628 RepID=UPI0022A8F0AD|nr:MspA family porin [Gordonia paraffinivorans]